MQQATWIPPLPPNWEGRFDPSQRRYFFINHLTKKTQWEDPRFPTQAPPAVAAAKSLSPTRDASRPSGQHSAYQMREITSPSTHSSQSHEESSLSEEVDQALVAKLMREFPQAGKELVVDMLVSCHNNERETREQMKDFGFGQSSSTNRASSHQSSNHSQGQDTVSTLSDAEKDRIITQIGSDFPALNERTVRMALDMVKYDLNKGKPLLQKLSEEELEKKANEKAAAAAATAARKEGSTSSASSSSSGNFLPAGLSDSASNRPQGLPSRPAAAPTSVTSRIASIPGPAPRANVSPTHQPQPINKAKQVTKKSNVPPKKTAVTQQPRQVKMSAPSALSSQRSNASGPDPSLRKGPDSSLLSSDMSLASGPDLTLRNGPDRSLRAGPNRSHVSGPMGARGPDSSFRCGPQNFALSSPTRVLVSDI